MGYLLAGDIGGTKTTLVIFDPGRGPQRPRVEKTFLSSRFASLEAMVAALLGAACYGLTTY